MSQSVRPVTGKLDVVALQPQRATDRVAQRLIVVDHDYPGRHLAPLLSQSLHVTVPSSQIQPRPRKPTLRQP
jgi:hypothetical protein